MGLKEAMSALAAKSVDQLTYTDVADTYIYYTRLDFDPVGIKFCANEDEVSKCKVNAKAKAKITYCQQLAMARGGHLAVYLPAERLLCENAEPVFGYRELDQEKDTKRHMKYLRNEELAVPITPPHRGRPLTQEPIQGYAVPIHAPERGAT